MQAAGGTPVGEGDGGPAEVSSAAPRPRTWWVFAATFVVLYVVDQITKIQAVEHLTGADDKPLIGEILQLRLVYNPGAAFGIGPDLTVAITVLAVVASLVVLWVSRTLRDKVWALSLGLLLAGIDGNLTDRLFREPQAFHGHVVDFLMLPNWPVFNVADICINVGAALALVQVFRGVGLDGTKETRSDPGADADADAGSDPEVAG